MKKRGRRRIHLSGRPRRVAITVPEDVRQRMREYQQRHAVNWSKLFTEAVVAHMDRVNAQGNTNQ